jgi:hypothetical protein
MDEARKNPKITGEYKAGRLRMLTVESSNIHSIGYDGDSKNLVVRFKAGSVYVYSDVPERVAVSFVAAESHGSFHYNHIRDIYDAERVELTDLPTRLRRDIKKEKREE